MNLRCTNKYSIKASRKKILTILNMVTANYWKRLSSNVFNLFQPRSDRRLEDEVANVEKLRGQPCFEAFGVFKIDTYLCTPPPPPPHNTELQQSKYGSTTIALQLLTTFNFIGPWYHAALVFSGLGSIVLLFGVLFSQQIREDLVRAATSPFY